MKKEEIIFLRESNFIEREYGIVALEDAKKAWEYAKRNKDYPSLEYVLGIHQRLMQRLNPKIAGKVREIGVRVGERICPYKPREELERNIADWIESYFLKEETIEGIIRSHVVFEMLHPFADGNGRTGRILMNAQMLKYGHPIKIIYEKNKWDYYDWFHPNITEFETVLIK